MPADISIFQSLAIGLVIAGFIILAWSFRNSLGQTVRRRLSRGGKPLPRSQSLADFEPPPHRSSPRSPTNPALRAVMDDAEELAQLISDRLDRQAARLEQLIAAADDRLTRLEQATSRPQPIAPAPQPLPRRDQTDPLARQIYDLSDRGLPPIEIARQLNQHTGKVELILALRQH